MPATGGSGANGPSISKRSLYSWSHDGLCTKFHARLASRPAQERIGFGPPGCTLIKLVRSYTLPLITHQQSFLWLCFWTSLRGTPSLTDGVFMTSANFLGIGVSRSVYVASGCMKR